MNISVGYSHDDYGANLQHLFESLGIVVKTACKQSNYTVSWTIVKSYLPCGVIREQILLQSRLQ